MKRVLGHILNLVEEMYNGETVRVRTECDVSAEFQVTVGLQQWSALSPFLFVVLPDVSRQFVTKE